MNAPAGKLPEPQRADIVEFFGNTIPDQIHLVAIVPDRAAIGRDFGTNVAAAADWALARNVEGKNVYFTVNRVRPGVNKKPTKDDIVGFRFTYVDVDPPKDGSLWYPEAAYQRLKNAPIPPSFIIWSGNGWQAFWRLDGPAKLDQVEESNKGLIAKFDGDGNAWNADRLLRVPGTVNWPNKKKKAAGRVPELARIECEDDGTVVSAAEMLEAYPAPEKEPTTGGKVELGNIELLTADDLDLPADDYVRT